MKGSLLRLDWATSDQVDVSRREFADGKPFPHMIIQDFVRDGKKLDQIQEELMEETFYEKANDLFSFHQSGDLAQCDSRAVKAIVKELYSPEFRAALTAVTGIELSDNIDLTSSLYRSTDVLLAHDDELLGRRVAFIMYLVPQDWSEEDGGSLDLFTVNANGKPDRIDKRITPCRNSFVFFEVSQVSFHQVAEVLSDNKHRLSIGGWFHGAPVKRPERCPAPAPNPVLSSCIDSIACDVPLGSKLTDADLSYLSGFIAKPYLTSKTQHQVAKQFEDESMIELSGFLSSQRLDAILRDLPAVSKDQWVTVGPYNERCFEAFSSYPTSNALTETRAMMQSPAMIKLLQVLTGNAVHITSTSSIIRRFAAGHYSLAFDNDPDAQRISLDVCLCLSQGDEENESGAVIYVDEEAEEPLAVISPARNALTVVLRAEPGTMRFVKYVNHQMAEPRVDIDLTCDIDDIVDIDDGQ
ncbi:Fe2OG dioxygenase domain-containing protein [Plasmodiophora brassicae]